MTLGLKPRLVGVACVALLLGILPARAQEDFGFMPKGGNLLFAQLYRKAPGAELRSLLTAKHSDAEWQAVLKPQAGALNEKEVRTIAAYLATNLPLPANALEQAVQPGKLAAALPPDGNELAWNYCQSCHSLFSGYLMQDRDRTGWLNVFLSPFHREIKLTTQQRETFAGYSAINMPMQRQDVPEDLRF